MSDLDHQIRDYLGAAAQDDPTGRPDTVYRAVLYAVLAECDHLESTGGLLDQHAAHCVRLAIADTLGVPDVPEPDVSAARLAFIVESNRIEGICRRPFDREISAHQTLWALERITVADLEDFVGIVAGQPLRRCHGQNVRVGAYVAPPGGPAIETALAELLDAIHAGDLTPYQAHRRYETLHPFLDGNGRSGRALWAWHMCRHSLDPFALPFLHRWYYQSLDASRED